jgi:photosystem II stability/assembly factor-like uncharacterized protein
MKADLSRDTFDRSLHFSAVRLQQGRIVTDADWNEQADLTRYRAERQARDTIGTCGTPLAAAGYALVAETTALAVHALNANVAWIAAEDGALLRTANGGVDWTLVDLATSANLRALAEVGGMGWAVGDGGVVRKTVNQGATWLTQDAGTLETLRGVAVFDSDHAWAVGDGGVVVATSDGGATWTLAKTGAARLHAVRFVDELTGVAVGRGGAIVVTSDGGQTWSNVASNTTSHLRALAAFGTTLMWGAGKGGTIVRTTDAGATWLACTTPSGTGALYAIAFRDANEGWAAGDGGALLHTTDGGANWSSEDASTEANLRGLSAFGSEPAWLVGAGSAVLRVGSGSPSVAATNLPTVNLSIEPGRCYVNGTPCELEERASYVNQPDGGAGARLTPGGYLIYLDAWQRHISALEAPAIREVALGGPDTATRARTITQVRALGLPPSSPFDWTCSSTIEAWDALINAQRPMLAARSEPQLAPASLCEIAATAGYRRLENQFYRIEVHTGGANPTFKWSRENGSVAYAVKSVSVDSTLKQTTVRLAARGRDANLDLAVNDRVELVDDDAELIGRAGQMFEYLNEGNDELELVLAGEPVGTLGQNPARHPILRRWNHRPTTAGDNVLPIVTGTWIELEDGVQIRFAPGGLFRPGDHWQVAARTTTADVEWPRDEDGDPLDRPPVGIADAYCRLGIIEVAPDGSITVVSDCRKLFPPLTEIDQLLYVSGDGQDAAPNAPLPQPLALRIARGTVPISGRRIRFEIESGAGSLGGGGAVFDAITDADGQATCDWQLGAGATAPARFQRVRASLLDPDGQPLPGQFLVFCATASLALRYVSGDGQTASAGAALPSPLELQVVNGADGIAGVTLRAVIEAGGGTTLGGTTRASDALGNAAFPWQLGGGGTQRLRVEMLDGAGQIVQQRRFEASTGGGVTPTERRGCEVTIGRGGDFERLDDELLQRLLERGRGTACICFLPGTHDLPELRGDGSGQFRLSLHGCGHASLINVRGPLIFDSFAALELHDLVMQTEGNNSLLLRKNREARLANVLFDRSNGDPRGAAIAVISAQSVSMTGCEILARMPAMAAMFEDITGVCRVMQNRFVGLVSFYGESDGAPSPDLVAALGNHREIRLRPDESQLSFCNNEVSQLTVGTEFARRLAATGTATRVSASAVIHGNTFLEQNNLAVGALVGYQTNVFLARPSGDRSFYGVTLATRATATGNVALILDPLALLQFVVPDPGSFSGAANQVNVQP